MIGATVLSLLGIVAVLAVHRVFLAGIGLLMQALEIRSLPIGFAFVMFALFGLVAGVMFVFLGYLRYVFLIARGKPAELSAFFSVGPLLLPGVLVCLCSVVAVLAGSLLIVGGLIAGILLVLAPVVLVDKGSSAFNALALSARVMSKNFLPGFLLLMTIGFPGNLLIALTCGLGVLIVAPLEVLLWSVIYLRATGRRTAID